MRTQLDDLKYRLKYIRKNIDYCKWKGVEGTDIHKHLIKREEEIISYINNIK